MLNRDCLGQNVRVEVMQANREMFGARASAVISCDFNATAIVFEDSTVYLGNGFVEKKATRSKFIHQVHQGNDFAKGG